jgi:small redox-active disulfide protein 2
VATVQILGTGCSCCGYLVANAEQAVKNSGHDVVVEKVTDIMQILSFQPLALPALAINGKVVNGGNVPMQPLSP